MNLDTALCFKSLLIFLLSWSVFGTLYTRCNDLSGIAYNQEPLFTSTCKTLMGATTQCLKCSLCDLIFRNGSQCSFHTAIDRAVTCSNGMSDGTVSKAKFRSCDCTLMPGVWARTGPFYMYVTPERYPCSQGQDVCKSLGGTMAEFYSIEEMNEALAYITAWNVYVGGSLKNNRFVWHSTGQEIMPSLWLAGQPDFSGPCVRLWKSKNGIDDISTGYTFPILCQKRIQ